MKGRHQLSAIARSEARTIKQQKQGRSEKQKPGRAIPALYCMAHAGAACIAKAEPEASACLFRDYRIARGLGLSY
jgi:hypothetical protein